MSVATGRSARLTSPSLLVAAILSALLLFAVSAVAAPGEALAATATRYAACDGVGLRVYAGTTGTLKARIPEGTRITIVATVSGGAYRATCDGKAVSGSKWYRISAVNGKSVRSLYGRTYVYAATGLFRTTPLLETRWAACDDVSLRSAAGTTGTLKDRLDAGERVTVVAKVTGGSWSADCAGRSVSGATWYRISGVNGKHVSTLYGTKYVYAATGLFASSSPFGTVPDSSTGGLTEGIDVSHWQGTIDWAKVRAAGKRFAFLKASESTDYVDPTYTKNRSGARANGLYVGAYHFAQPGTQSGDAVAEADHFLAAAQPARGDLVPVLDLEVTNGLSPSQLQTWARSFVERIYQKTGLRAILYVSPAFWRNSMGDTTWFANNGYKVLWIAHWTTVSSPSVPASNWGGEGWTFWQYSSSGTVPGISGRVDLNRYNGTDFRPVLVP